MNNQLAFPNSLYGTGDNHRGIPGYNRLSDQVWVEEKRHHTRCERETNGILPASKHSRPPPMQRHNT